MPTPTPLCPTLCTKISRFLETYRNQLLHNRAVKRISKKASGWCEKRPGKYAVILVNFFWHLLTRIGQVNTSLTRCQACVGPIDSTRHMLFLLSRSSLHSAYPLLRIFCIIQDHWLAGIAAMTLIMSIRCVLTRVSWVGTSVSTRCPTRVGRLNTNWH